MVLLWFLNSLSNFEVLCHFSVFLYPIPFQSQKGTFMIVTPFTYQQCLHPVGMTDLWLFMWKFNHDSVNLHRISTKISMEVHFNKSSMCTKVQLDQSMCLQLHFMAENAKYAKRRRNDEIITKFCSNASRDWLARFASCQDIHSVAPWLLRLHGTLPCVLIQKESLAS